ncbi:hypothetical protein QI633_00600 [Nocardioides sp. QY071]|jgi:hypothetical protein|uniref:hypothetical protein n=1 Tax=Nocardioides sp. QY071 TaxID=3044187 RepID=UPI00249CDD0E|nr:hypothetical protein [Nocardioides sp. QY071]WGY02271.1 hypothetical protein QI633_00600 [Nocardioides sp. QY071]
MTFRSLGVAALAVVLILGGCGVDDRKGAAGLARLQDSVVARTREVVGVLAGAGLEVTRAAGAAEYCRSEPAPGVTYRSGGAVAGTPAEVPAQFAAAREALLAAGWVVVTEGTDGGRPWANLGRDGLRLGLSQAKHGERLLGFALTSAECVDVADGGFLDDDDRRVDLLATEK